jgi:hypothetical protein
MLRALLLLIAAQSESGLEERLIQQSIDSIQGQRELNPEGKTIDDIVIVADNIFSKLDPWPDFLNVFHVRTREEVIAREVLVRIGEHYNAKSIEETERNLRRLSSTFAIARVVALRSSLGGVVVLIVTKDKWSLRVNSDFTLIGGLLQSLRLQPAENNFRGLNQQLAADFILRLDTISLGQSFTERRLFGSRYIVSEAINLIFNRSSFRLEGSSGSVLFGKPLVSLDQPFGFATDASWNIRRRRVFRGASIFRLPYPNAEDAPKVPLAYDVREVRGEASFVKSLGLAWKTDLSVALGAYSRSYTPLAESQLTAEQAEWLTANYLPRTETTPYLAGFVRSYPSTFKVLRNINTYELSEDVQIGPLLQASAMWAPPTPFIPATFSELAAGIRYRFYGYENLLTLSLSTGVRVRSGAAPANRRVVFEVQNFSPPFFGGRFMARVLADLKFNDLDNRQLLLGGSNGVRGAFPEQFTGRNIVLGNFEFRPRPVDLWSSRFGVVLFYDVGSAFDEVVQLTHSVGFGLRILLPQFNQDVIRIDFGVVVQGATPGLDRLNAAFGQVNELRPSFLDSPSQGIGVGALPSIR